MDKFNPMNVSSVMGKGASIKAPELPKDINTEQAAPPTPTPTPITPVVSTSTQTTTEPASPVIPLAQTNPTANSGLERRLAALDSPEAADKIADIDEKIELFLLVKKITDGVWWKGSAINSQITDADKELLHKYGYYDTTYSYLLQNADYWSDTLAEVSGMVSASIDSRINDIEAVKTSLTDYANNSSGAQYFQEVNGEKVLSLDDLYEEMFANQAVNEPIGMHNYTGEEIAKMLKGQTLGGPEPLSYDWDSIRKSLLDAGMNSEDSQYVLDMLSYDIDTILASLDQMETELAGYKELTSARPMTTWDKIYFTVTRPFVAVNTEFAKPVAGAVALLFTGDIFRDGANSKAEEEYITTLAALEEEDDSIWQRLLNYKTALSASEEARPIWWQLVGETVFDPTSYIGFSRAVTLPASATKLLTTSARAARLSARISTVAKTTPRLLGRQSNRIGVYSEIMTRAGAPSSIARMSNVLELGFQDLIEMPFVKAKGWYTGGAKIGGKLIGQPGKVMQLAVKSEKQIVQTESRKGAMLLSGYAIQAARMATRKWIPSAEDCIQALHRAIDTAIEEPFVGGTAAKVGKEILSHFTSYFSKQDYADWAKVLGKNIGKEGISAQDLAYITQALDLTPGLGTVPKAFKSELELAQYIADTIVKGEFNITEKMLSDIMRLIKGRAAASRDLAKVWIADNMDNGARKFAGSVYNLIYHDLAGYPKDNIIGKVGSDVFVQTYRQGVINSIIRHTDPRWLAATRESLEKYITMPFAKSYLLFAAYGPMNFLETWFKGGIAGGGWRFKVGWSEVTRAQRNWNHLTNKLYDLSTFVPRKGFIAIWKNTPETVRIEMLKTGASRKTLLEKLLSPRFLEVPLIELQGEFGMQRLAYTMNNWMIRQLEEIAPETCVSAFDVVNRAMKNMPELDLMLKKAGLKKSELIKELYEQILVDSEGIASLIGRVTAKNLSASKVFDACKKYTTVRSIYKDMLAVMVEDGAIFDAASLAEVKSNIAKMMTEEYALSSEFWALKYKTLADSIKKTPIKDFTTLSRTIQNINELVIFQDQTVFYLERSLAREADSIMNTVEKNALYIEQETKMADFLKSSGESIDSIISTVKGSLNAFDNTPEFIGKRALIDSLLDLQSRYWKSIEAVRTKVWTESRKAFELTPKAGRNADWWATFKYKRAQIWSEAQPFQIESMADMTALYDNFAGVSISKLPDVTAGVTPYSISQLWGTDINAVYKNLFDQNFGVVMPKDAFVAYNLNRATSIAKKSGANPTNLGWTRESIGEAYDSALRSIRIDPENTVFDSGVMMQYESMFKEIDQIVSNSALPEGTIKALKKLGADIKTNADNIPGMRKPVVQKTVTEVPIPADEPTITVAGKENLFSSVKSYIPERLSNFINDIRFPANEAEEYILESSRAMAKWLPDSKTILVRDGFTAKSINHELSHAYFSLVREKFGSSMQKQFIKSTVEPIEYLLDGYKFSEINSELLDSMLQASNIQLSDLVETLERVKALKGTVTSISDKDIYILNDFASEVFNSWTTGERFFTNSANEATFKKMLPKSFAFSDSEVAKLGELHSSRILADKAAGMSPVEYLTAGKPATTKKFVTEEVTGNSISDSWLATQESAMLEVRKKYSRVFADYDPANQSVIDEYARSIFPFWTYQTHRWTWLAENFAKHPGMYFTLKRYEEKTDRGYISIPGTDIEFNPFRGTIFGNFVTRLTQRDYPEYYDTSPLLSQIEDTMGRYGFYPGALASIPMTIFGSKSGKPQWGTILPGSYKTLLSAIEAVVPDELAATMREIIYPDYFRDYQIILAVNRNGARGDIIWSKKHEGVALTEEEEQAWNDAARDIAGLQIIFEQGAMFRFRPEEMIKAYETTSKIIEVYTGISVEQQEELRNRGMRVSDVIPISPELSTILNSLESIKNWSGMTLPLMPTEMQGDSAKRELFWSDVEEKNKEFEARQVTVDTRFQNREITPKQWLSGTQDIASDRADYIDNLHSSSYYKDVPITTEEMQAWYNRTGRTVPLMHPERELMNLYYSLSPSEYFDPETETWATNWDLYYSQVDLIFDSLPEDIRESFITNITKNWSPMRTLYWDINREYIRPYRNRFDLVLQTFSPEDQLKVRNYYAATTVTERESLSQDPAVKQFKSMYSTAGERLRQMSPTLDAWLNFFGQASTFKTDAARTKYNEICSGLGMIP